MLKYFAPINFLLQGTPSGDLSVQPPFHFDGAGPSMPCSPKLFDSGHTPISKIFQTLGLTQLKKNNKKEKEKEKRKKIYRCQDWR